MPKTDFDYYYGVEAEQFTFVRVPKVLFTDKEHFGGLSNEAKLLYGLLLERMSLSRKNNWIDKHNRVYIIFPVEEIEESLDVGHEKALNLLKELDDQSGIGLVKKKRRGLGLPSILYVKNFIVIITFTFFLCLSLMLMLSATVSTMNSDSLAATFGWANCDIYLDSKMVMECMLEGGDEKLEKHLDDMEKTLAENGIPAKCYQEMMFSLPVVHGEKKSNITIYQGTGTTMDMYEYTEGTAPQNTNEIAITRISAETLNANIGDTVTIKTVDGDKEYIISAFFQSMNMQGVGIRLHSDEYINYVQANGGNNTQIKFTDNPDSEEIQRRIGEIQRIFPDYENIKTCAEAVADMVGVAGTLDTVKSLVVMLTIVLSALITVLMERSFIAKEQGEIALMKAVGMRNGKIYAYHTLRFLFVGIIAVIIGEALALPLTHLCIDPIFKMMGMELAVGYVINPAEMYLLFPLVILLTTTVSAFLTSLYTRKIKSSDTANIE